MYNYVVSLNQTCIFNQFVNSTRMAKSIKQRYKNLITEKLQTDNKNWLTLMSIMFDEKPTMLLISYLTFDYDQLVH